MSSSSQFSSLFDFEPNGIIVFLRFNPTNTIYLPPLAILLYLDTNTYFQFEIGTLLYSINTSIT